MGVALFCLIFWMGIRRSMKLKEAYPFCGLQGGCQQKTYLCCHISPRCDRNLCFLAVIESWRPVPEDDCVTMAFKIRLLDFHTVTLCWHVQSDWRRQSFQEIDSCDCWKKIMTFKSHISNCAPKVVTLILVRIIWKSQGQSMAEYIALTCI